MYSYWDITGVHTIKIKHAITKSKHPALVSKVWTVFALASFYYILKNIALNKVILKSALNHSSSLL